MTVLIDAPPVPVRTRTHTPWLGRVLALATAILLADALFGDRGLAETLRARQAYRQAVVAVKEVRRENAALQERARMLREDAATIEAEARRELGLARPGEVLFVIKQRKPSARQSPTE